MTISGHSTTFNAPTVRGLPIPPGLPLIRRGFNGASQQSGGSGRRRGKARNHGHKEADCLTPAAEELKTERSNASDTATADHSTKVDNKNGTSKETESRDAKEKMGSILAAPSFVKIKKENEDP
ncbi:hypothetical protein LTR09_007516 [Extremus antarcticus]|uniref:Uncharacterized protein n=1 Tax=Extremus antarcticus TaxID=702011 RepID=A0AAJ0GD16_9PEZI|nr:hypothetical protein LTR09_007516 [Extremus antarcticus]